MIQVRTLSPFCCGLLPTFRPLRPFSRQSYRKCNQSSLYTNIHVSYYSVLIRDSCCPAITYGCPKEIINGYRLGDILVVTDCTCKPLYKGTPYDIYNFSICRCKMHLYFSKGGPTTVIKIKIKR